MENTNSRRDFLIKSATLVIGSLAASSILNEAFAAGNFPESNLISPEAGKFTLPSLPYTYEALEPHIDEMTMKFHHDRHHRAYVDNLNKALETVDSSLLPNQSFETIFANVAKLPPAVRNNAGGHYNHSLFWTLMAAPKMIGDVAANNSPAGKLSAAIVKTFGSVDEFKKQFSDAAAKRFGSGWAWLVKTHDGKLVITSTANQDNPLMSLDSVEVKGKPVLALDVWEHAYYLKNQNRRADYIASWWNVVNWETAESLYTNK